LSALGSAGHPGSRPPPPWGQRQGVRVGDDQGAIGVIGVGYVGLVSAVCFAHLGHKVFCLDVDERRIAALRAGQMPIYEPGLDKLLEDNVERLSFHHVVPRAAGRPAASLFIAIDTPPSPSGDADLSHVAPRRRQGGGRRRRSPAGHEEHGACGHRRGAAGRPAGRRRRRRALRQLSGVPARGRRHRGLPGSGPHRHRIVRRGRRRTTSRSCTVGIDAQVLRTTVPTAEMIQVRLQRVPRH